MLAVKSSVSIVLTGGFADLSVTVYVTMEQFLTVFVLVIPFYFGARTEKRMNEFNDHKGIAYQDGFPDLGSLQKDWMIKKFSWSLCVLSMIQLTGSAGQYRLKWVI